MAVYKNILILLKFYIINRAEFANPYNGFKQSIVRHAVIIKLQVKLIHRLLNGLDFIHNSRLHFFEKKLF